MFPTKMHRTSFLTLSAFFSIVCHLTFIQFFETYKKKDQEIIVMDLSLFKEFKVEKKIAPNTQKNNEKIIEKKPPKKEEKIIEKKPLKKMTKKFH